MALHPAYPSTMRSTDFSNGVHISRKNHSEINEEPLKEPDHDRTYLG